MLVTGYDILFFWVARMMMLGLYAMDGVRPFDTIALHGMVRDQFGKKMSKTVGNTVDPNEWMDVYGTDATRFALARVANPGIDAPIGDDNVAAARNFGTKLWNAARFALANGASPALPLPSTPRRRDADAWILGRLREVTAQVDALLEDFQFAKATEALYHFTWDELCDWYLELAKPQLASAGTAEGTRAVLGHVLDVLVRLLHPVSPFLTEALYQALTGAESVVTAPWPTAVGLPVDTGRGRGGSPICRRSSPTSAASAPSSGCPTSGGSRPASSASTRPGSARTGGARRARAARRAGGRVRCRRPRSRSRCPAARSSSSSTRRARSTSPPSAPGWAAISPPRRRSSTRRPKKLGNPAFVAKAPAHVVDDIRGRQARRPPTSSGSRRGWRRFPT